MELDRPLSWICRRLAGVGAVRSAGSRLRAVYRPRYQGRDGRWVEIADYDGDLRMRLDRGSYLGSAIYWRGYHHRRETRWLGAFLRPGMVFVDAGANQGEFTLFAAKRVGPDGRVLAFEPAADMYALLAGNVARNGFGQVRLYRLGLGERDATLPLFGRGAARSGEDPHLYSTYRVGAASGPVERVGEIRLRRLDDVLAEDPVARVDVVKVDVEGGELPILRGAVRTLERHAPWLILELNRETFAAAGYTAPDVARFLADRGYLLSRFVGRGLAPLAPEAVDALPESTNVLARPPRGHGPP